MIGYLIVFIIIIIAITAGYLAYSRSDWRRRRRAESYIARSAGGFDDGAQRALQELMQMDSPTAADRLTRAAIIEYNLFEGAAAAHPEARVDIAQDYTIVLNNIHEVDRPQFYLGRMRQFHERIGGAAEAFEPAVDIFIAAFENIEPAVTTATVNERRTRAANAADNRAEATEMFFEDATDWVDDPQNVHDSSVNNDLNETFQALRRDRPENSVSPPKAITEARNEARLKLNPDSASKVNRVLDMIAQGNRISTFGNAAEDEIFALVWNRRLHPNNKGRKNNITTAILDALTSAVEHDSVVCANGRAARVLNSLMLVDFDPDTGKAMTSAAYKNQIYAETQEILADEIKLGQASADAEWRAVADSFAGETDEEPPAELHIQFVNNVKRRIDENLAKYTSKLSAATIENLRAECYAGVDM